MPSPDLPVTISSTYTDSGNDASIALHQHHHDVIHRIVNQFDTDLDATSAGEVLASDGAVFGPRNLLATDIPAVVTSTHTGSYTLALRDAGTTVEMNVVTVNTLTVPPSSSVAFPLGTVIAVRQYGAGTTTVKGATGVVIRSRGGCLATAGRYAEATLTKRSADEWLLVGDVA